MTEGHMFLKEALKTSGAQSLLYARTAPRSPSPTSGLMCQVGLGHRSHTRPSSHAWHVVSWSRRESTAHPKQVVQPQAWG